MFELNKNNIKKILLVITYTVLIIFALFKFSVILSAISYVLKLLTPFILGFCIAFILNIPMSTIERMLMKRKNSKKGKHAKKQGNTSRGIRVISLIASILIFVGIITITLVLVIPDLIETVSIFKESIPTAANTLKDWAITVSSNYPEVLERINEITIDWTQIDTELTDTLKSAATGILGTSLNVVTSLVAGVVNFFMGVIFAVYMLLQKEKLILQIKKILRTMIKSKKCDTLFHIGEITNDTFKKFFAGQFTEAVILGVLCFIGMKIFSMPYAITISVLVGVTALIPVFGAFFGTAIGAILILAVNPLKALWFVIYIIVVQQIDGNFIYPRVVGNSVGLPAIWVMLAVLVGGSGFGIVGMLVAVPIFSVVYKLIGEYVNNKDKIKTVNEKSST